MHIISSKPCTNLGHEYCCFINMETEVVYLVPQQLLAGTQTSQQPDSKPNCDHLAI